MVVSRIARAMVAPLLAEGLSLEAIAARLGYGREYVREVRAALTRHLRPRVVYAPWVPPDPGADEREAALDRGRRLALAKVAAGEWVAPGRPQQRTKGVVA